ncbi:hypothetical protein K2173_027793 [Erythroxylum novogranatense]|uniref:BUB1 N-terminal domain-containing protein n=1 Tax=Erythroxylum novogranatense TaxID=1862640 RepID=A0AAV8U021_9ROSI|nr:hypothetical protein K2173_027793 [Erythroxylum novogranatense]
MEAGTIVGNNGIRKVREEEDEGWLDPETEFLASKRETGNEWELFKENVRPLKRGRNVHVLNQTLKSQTNNTLKNSLLYTRSKLIGAIDEYEGDDPLLPWLQCIKWVQEAFPPGGDCSGLIVIYEQCVRTFWNSHQYKDDLRYLKVWLEYAESCDDAQVIYTFLDANEIGISHSAYYIAYALHMESKSKTKAANDIFYLGISRDAQPAEKLNDAYKKFLLRSTRRPKVMEEDSGETHLTARSFGTVLAGAENGRRNVGSSSYSRKELKTDRIQRAPLSIYKDKSENVMLGHQSEKSKTDLNTWSSLGGRAERNKENNAAPTKWTTYKIPQRPGPRIGGPTPSACIQVFVDDECRKTEQSDSNTAKSSTLKLRGQDDSDIKKETELLRQNPLRHFPSNSLPR